MSDELTQLQQQYTELIESSKEIEEELEQAIEEGEKKIEKLTYELEDKKDEIQRLVTKYQLVSTNLSTIQQELEGQKQHVDELKQSIQQKEQVIDDQENEIRQRQANEEELQYKLEKSIEEKVFLQNDYDELYQEYQVRTERMRTEIADLNSELVAIRQRQQPEGVIQEVRQEVETLQQEKKTHAEQDESTMSISETAVPGIEEKVNQLNIKESPESTPIESSPLTTPTLNRPTYNFMINYNRPIQLFYNISKQNTGIMKELGKTELVYMDTQRFKCDYIYDSSEQWDLEVYINTMLAGSNVGLFIYDHSTSSTQMEQFTCTIAKHLLPQVQDSGSLQLTMLEIKNEQVVDLLSNAELRILLSYSATRKALSILNASKHPISSLDALQERLRSMNYPSSYPTITILEYSIHNIHSKCYLIDLKPQTSPKAVANFGEVLTAVIQQRQFIPYRNSKLTYVLQDIFGHATAKSALFLNLTDSHELKQETLAKLQFGWNIIKESIPRKSPISKIGQSEPKYTYKQKEKSMKKAIRDRTLRVQTCIGGSRIPGPKQRSSLRAAIDLYSKPVNVKSIPAPKRIKRPILTPSGWK